MNRKPSHCSAWSVALACALFLTGCVTPAPTPALEAPADPLSLPREEIVGQVVLVEVEDGVALVRIHSSSTRVPAFLIARNDALVETARMEPTRFQRGRTLGARILSGLPNVGDEVIGIPAQ